MKNLIFLIDTLEIGGAENSMLTLYKNLKPEYNISIVVLKKVSKKLKRDFNLFEINSRRILSLTSIFSLFKLLKKRNRTTIVSFAPEIAFIVNIANLALFRTHKIALSFRNSFNYYSDFSKIYIYFLFLVACVPSHAFHFLTHSNKISYEKFSLLKFFLNNKKSIIIPNYLRYLNNNSPIKRDYKYKPQIIFIGRLCNQKRPFEFIKFCDLLNNQFPNIFTYHIFGDGPLKESILKNINEKDNEKDFKIYGKVKHIGSFLKNPFALILTSSYEGHPGVVGEAITSGIPVFSFPYDSFIINLLRKTSHSKVSDECTAKSLFDVFLKEYSNLFSKDLFSMDDAKIIQSIFDRFVITKSWISFLKIIE